MRAILIDPWTKTITEVQRDDDYRTIYPLISAPGHKVHTFDLVRLDNRDGIYVDDEGLLVSPRPPMFRIGDARLAGKGLVCGSNAEGECAEPVISIDQLKAMVSWEINAALDLWTPIHAEA